MLYAYIGGVLVTTKDKISKHMKVLENLLEKLVGEGLKLNTENLLFGRTETKNLGFWFREKGVKGLYHPN